MLFLLFSGFYVAGGAEGVVDNFGSFKSPVEQQVANFGAKAAVDFEI